MAPFPVRDSHRRRHAADAFSERIPGSEPRYPEPPTTTKRGIAALILCLAAVAFSGCSRASEKAARGEKPLFSEEGSTRGLTGHHAPFRLLMAPSMNGGGALEDLDGDDDLDMYLTRYNQPNLVLLNDGLGTFSVPAHRTGLEIEGASGTPLFGDVDGDGDRDAFVTPTNYGRPYLLINTKGHFVDETESRGIALTSRELAGETGSFAYGARFVDLDHDGDLDVLVGEWGPVEGVHASRDSRVAYYFRNDGSGRFVNAAEAAGLSDLAASAVFGFADLDVDGDGWEDLLVAGDFGTSRLFRSQDGTRFVDATSQALPAPVAVSATSDAGDSELVYNAMGSTVADMDGNATLDWIVSAIGSPGELDSGAVGCVDNVQSSGSFDAALVVRCTGNRVYSFDGTGRAIDRTQTLGVRNGGWAWGISAADLNVDGSIDLALTNGYVMDYQPGVTPKTVVVDGEVRDETELPLYTEALADKNRLWISGQQDLGASRLSEAAERSGFASTGQGRALIPGDVDRDGDIDLLQVNDGDAAPELFINQFNPEPGGWIAVRVDPGGDGPPDCVGCIVTITTEDGNTQIRRIPGSGSFSSHDPHEAQFGFGNPHTSVTVSVSVPGGPPMAAKLATGGLRELTR